jgi:ribosomal protein L9
MRAFPSSSPQAYLSSILLWDHKRLTGTQSKEKQSKAKQSKAKQSKAKQSKTKQSKTKQNKAKHTNTFHSTPSDDVFSRCPCKQQERNLHHPQISSKRRIIRKQTDNSMTIQPHKSCNRRLRLQAHQIMIPLLRHAHLAGTTLVQISAGLATQTKAHTVNAQ